MVGRATVKVTVSLPRELVEALRKRTTNLSAYVAEAAQARLQAERYREALDRAHGAWRADLHPELADAEGVVAYVRRLRQQWRPYQAE